MALHVYLGEGDARVGYDDGLDQLAQVGALAVAYGGVTSSSPVMNRTRSSACCTASRASSMPGSMARAGYRNRTA